MSTFNNPGECAWCEETFSENAAAHGCGLDDAGVCEPCSRSIQVVDPTSRPHAIADFPDDN